MLEAIKQRPVGRNYKWIALSNTSLGILMTSINASTMLIALPAVFRGIKLDPLASGNSAYLLWIQMGYALVQAGLVVTLGRIGDMFGRVRMYNLGFVIFTIGSILLSITWSTGSAGAMEIIIFRMIQALGGALEVSNSAAILTDAFPANQRGMALGINMLVMTIGMFAGTLIGGVFAEAHWRWVFLINVPFGIIGTVWAYLMLREVGEHQRESVDWIGNITFVAGLTMIMVGIIYGTTPTATSTTGWTTPFVLGMLIGGVILIGIFLIVEQHVKAPLFRLPLFRIRAFTTGNIAALFQSLARGGLLFMLSIWLQAIWLPLHGYSYEVTPLWAGISLMPEFAAVTVFGVIAGRLFDRFGAANYFTTAAMIIEAVAFSLLLIQPVNFNYVHFALILVLSGLGIGLFAAPNTTAIMNSLPAKYRGVGSGMRITFQNVAQPLSQGIFMTLMVVGLNATVPKAIYDGLIQNGVSVSIATQLSKVSPYNYLFAALMGQNPLGSLLGPGTLSSLNPTVVAQITSRSFFPQLISGAFQHGLRIVLIWSITLCLIAACFSWFRGGKYVYHEPEK